MKKFLFTLSTLIFLAFAGSINAAGTINGGYGAPCQPIYGGGEVCVSKGNILIDKTVQNPQTGAFVDNLSLSNDPRFVSGQDIIFQLTISNTGGENFQEVEVVDVFPSHLTFISGPGNFNPDTRTLTFKIQNLNAGQSEVFNLVARVVSENLLPQDQAVNCVINQVKARTGENESSDLAQVCIEKTVTTTKGGLPVMDAPPLKETPDTGPGLLSLLGLIPVGLAGFYIRRKANK